ncbi:MAG: PadR family transcriptional regulator [Syntrophaceae bacterium]|nr:PadR family transcriptional regulator [Syntrophaceae bacterium]
MADLSSAEAALLGLLCEGEMHAYQLEKTVAYRSMRDWTDLSMSSIYKVMRKLEKTGLAVSRSDITKSNKIRKTYAVTATGRKAIQAQLLKWLEEPETIKYRLDLAVYNFNHIPRAKALKALKAYRQALGKGIKCYWQLEKFLVKDGCPSFRLALARRPRHLLAAERDWVDAFVKEMGGKGRVGGEK